MLNLPALDRMRPWPVYLMAAALPVSMAVTSLSKMLIVVFALPILLSAVWRQQALKPLASFLSVKTALVLLAALGVGTLYADIPWLQSLGDWGKYAKLIMLPLTLLLLRTKQQCGYAIATLLVAQTFVLISSMLLSLGVTLPWVPVQRNAVATVFSSYLDQAIMTAGYAAMCWHLRTQLGQRSLQWFAGSLAALALVNVMGVLPGRSGQMAMLVTITLAVWWALPQRLRWLIVAAPLVVASVAAVVPSRFQDRMGSAVHEVQAYAAQGDKSTSSGIRLNFWHRSLEAIADKPWTGHGTGSWSKQFLQRADPEESLGQNERSNPHQEYLQLGVQLGVGGIALFLAWMLLLARDARRFSLPVGRAMQSMVGVMAMACMFNSSLFDALIGDYFVGVLGMLMALGYCDIASSQDPSSASEKAATIPT